MSKTSITLSCLTTLLLIVSCVLQYDAYRMLTANRMVAAQHIRTALYNTHSHCKE